MSISFILSGCMSIDLTSGDVDQSSDLYPRVKLKVFLAGAYTAGSMSTQLNSLGYIPLNHPYSAAGFSYSGTEAVSTSFLNLNSNIVDWILIELRSTPNGATVASRAAFLLSDGSVLDIDGNLGAKFPTVSEGAYYIVVKHRNHMSGMSAVSHLVETNPSVYDFTTSVNQYYGAGAIAIDAGAGVYAHYAGDLNLDGAVDIADSPDISNNDNLTGYQLGDLDFDGTIEGGVGEQDINIFNQGNLDFAFTGVP